MYLIEELEQKLDSFDAAERRQALSELRKKADTGEAALAECGKFINLHCHTFFSYNSYGYSPSKFAWLARKNGLAAAGIVDFDVLDGLEEFLEAGRILGLKTCGGLETRVFVPELADKIINSPGEPGICYYTGLGFPSAELPVEEQKFLDNLGETARRRNEDLVESVNRYLRPVELDYQNDVLVLTPSGNATERHICLAFARKAGLAFSDVEKLISFWSEKLDLDASLLELPDGQSLLNAIRSKTMKQGGVGYVQPDSGLFPGIRETSNFILAAGGLPTFTWLDPAETGGMRAEKEIERLLEVMVKNGVAVLNTIGGYNYKPHTKSEKLERFYHLITLAEKFGLPVVTGTEMHSSGQKFIGSFDTEELSSFVPIFLRGAHIVFAHSVLQREAGLGYSSGWAEANFEGVSEEEEFFGTFGSVFEAGQEEVFSGVTEDTPAEEILEKVKKWTGKQKIC